MRTRKLERCERCWQPLPACICDLVRPIHVETGLLLLMHHLESRKTTNTGRLAAFALGARLALWGEPDVAPPTLPTGRVLLLFPSVDSRALVASDRAVDITLVVPDGNWPQARRMARRVEAACAGRVERVHVEGVGRSRYGLRCTTRDGALSTFESIAHALAELEGDRGAEVLRESLALFDGFVARQSAFGRHPRA